MDEDEDIQSLPSPERKSHSPPQPRPQPQPQQPPQQPPLSGQITVTVAAAPPSTTTNTPPPLASTSLSIVPVALPISHLSSRIPTAIPTSIGVASGGGGGGGSGGGREDCWSEGATSVLIDAWGERYMELSRGNLKQKHWKEVADIVSSREDYTKPPKTDIQCKNRIDTVKKKYKIEKAKVSTGNGPSRWPFFDRLDRLIGPTANVTPTSTPISSSGRGGSGLGFATVSPSNGGPPSSRAVPVGIPVRVGVRSSPLPFSPQYIQTPHHLQSGQSPQQQQQLRHNFNFATPPNVVPQLRYNNTPLGVANTSVNNNNTNNSRGGGGGGNVNIGGSRQAQTMLLAAQQQQQRMLLQSIQQQQQKQQQKQIRKYPAMPDSDSEQEEWSNESGDSLPPERRRELGNGKRPRMMMMEGGFGGGGGGGGESGAKKVKTNKSKKGKEKKGSRAAVRNWGNSVRDLTMAILKFGEAYEAAESKKLQHVREMELQRMKFAKELELQTMKFMMKTQLELSQFNDNGNSNGNGSNNSDSRGGGSGGGVGGGESDRYHHHRHNHIHENHITHANSDSSN